jgi:polysaccharide biosynthesis/export protein
MKTQSAFVLLFSIFVLFLSPLSAQPRPVVKPDEKQATPYRITRGDVLAVSVFGEPELTSGSNKVEGRGTIALQLIKEIRVAGLTVLEAQQAIQNAYREGRYLRDPQVKITIEQYAQRLVSIMGKVNQPAKYELPPDQPWTIKDLIIKAGGFTDTARGREVRVTRTLPDGTLKTYTLDLQNTLLGKDKTSNPDAAFVLEPDDYIYVPERII